MKAERMPYSALPSRPPLRWPNGARVAVWVVPNVEHYEYLPDPIRGRDPWPRMPHPDILGYGQRDYGNRVGFWRMTEVTDALGIPVTLSLNLANWEHYPDIMEASVVRGWDVMCHGIYNTQYHWGLPEDEERAIIAECVETYRRLTGGTLSGWFSPAATFTPNTPDLLAEAGIGYYCDWYHDDQPTWMNTRAGRLLTIPYQMDINDAMVLRHALEAEDFARMIVDHFDTLWEEGAEHGRVVCIALHPYIMGHPHRIRHLERALRHIIEHEGVWLATGREIADWYRGQHPAPVEDGL
ncbi:MAG: polysaccharide deacetylase family protein [Alphaproteobacteria bacterium]|jgi:peptidoglycan/xylan/chitin deacetylase (PgdA/CDA1 family)|nr:polysaccharide deacetylase family protein [Alphaproteobacteria bacterium]